MEPPPPPAIAVGSYYTVPEAEAGSGSSENESWSIDLPQGGESTQASVERCVSWSDCTRNTVPVRTGLNGLSMTFPAEHGQVAVDLAISVTPSGLVLSSNSGGILRQMDLHRPED